MRIQEHIYQGFFGLKKKQDAIKYYHERVENLKGFDKNLDVIIEAFQHILINHNNKLNNYHEFLKKPTKDTFTTVRREIEKLKGMFDEDEIANDKGQKYALKGIDELEKLTKNEDCVELGQLERESITDLKELSRLLKSINPIWQAQIDFMKQNDEAILEDNNNIRILSDILKEEGDILWLEESLLHKIDLKTGTILIKATLKERDIDRTKDMDMKYRELKYIR
jgi:hypothetical protein